MYAINIPIIVINIQSNEGYVGIVYLFSTYSDEFLSVDVINIALPMRDI